MTILQIVIESVSRVCSATEENNMLEWVVIPDDVVNKDDGNCKFYAGNKLARANQSPNAYVPMLRSRRRRTCPAESKRAHRQHKLATRKGAVAEYLYRASSWKDFPREASFMLGHRGAELSSRCFRARYRFVAIHHYPHSRKHRLACHVQSQAASLRRVRNSCA